MYTAQPEGYLELELGDWRAERYILVWSNTSIVNVSVWIDETYLGRANQTSNASNGTDNNPLYVLPWSPSQLVGASTLRVEATVSCNG
ncbi:hypothetical protein D915_010450 [Fasciola hepatica]|uniref:TMEM62 Ig-like domain-containing protein n=1 Tax=Fasciola hepatica TaxID=6192 RepID=A0A4E0QWG0_FASHE|nr:hypothetical protein D915_010450 [Fasciola hepatica]